MRFRQKDGAVFKVPRCANSRLGSLSDLTKPAAGVVDLMEALLPIEGRKPVKEMAAKKPASKVGLPSASKVGSNAAAPKLIVCGLKFCRA